MLTIYTLIEQKKGSLPTVGAFLDLEDAKKALLDRQEQLSTDYRRSEPIDDPRLYSNYILENIRGTGEEILLRLSTTEVKGSPLSRRLEIPLLDSNDSIWVLRDALDNELDKIQAIIYRNQRSDDERNVEKYQRLETLYKNKLEELKEIEEHFFDEDF